MNPRTSVIRTKAETALADSFAQASASLPGGDVVGPAGARAGIRPENLHLADTGLAATVQHAEYLGADTVVACTLADGQTLLARLPGRADLPDGAAVRFAYDHANLHRFDAGSGRRLA